MATNKYRVKVVVRAGCEYEVEVCASSETEANDLASAMWRSKLPSDFDVEKGYVTDWVADETVQIRWACNECDREISKAENDEYDEMCKFCYDEAEAS